MNSGIMLAILRIVSGLLFLEHGLQRSPVFRRRRSSRVPPLNPCRHGGGTSSLVAACSHRHRPVHPARRFLASGTMAVAYWYAHAPNNFFGQQYGRRGVLYCFVFLYLVLRAPDYAPSVTRPRQQRPPQN
jgi:putative oxidoreductase